MLGAAESRSVLGILPMLAAAEEHGVSQKRLLRAGRIAPALLDDPEATVSLEQELALVRELLTATNDPHFGLAAGKAYHLPMFGYLGAAAHACPNGRAAVRLFVENHQHTYTPFAVREVEDPKELRVLFTDRVDLGAFRTFYLERSFVFAVGLAKQLLPDRFREMVLRVDFDFASDAQMKRVKAAFACPVRFGCNVAALVFDPRADGPRAEGSALWQRISEEHLHSFVTPKADGDLANRVRTEIARAVGQHGLPDAQRVGHALGIGERTLRRRLEQEGTSFREIADGVITTVAVHHLRETDLPIESIAERLGYSEAASFVRAFRRSAGTTPQRYRARLRGRKPARRGGKPLRAR